MTILGLHLCIFIDFIALIHASWSHAFRRLFLACLEHSTSEMAYLPDDVTGREELGLDGCILSCRRKGVSYMALKTTTCYCTEFIPADYTGTSIDKCKPMDCPTSFKCGKWNTLALYKVCQDGHFGEHCENKCFCESFTCRVRDGWCLASDGRCKRGYVGRACNITDPCLKKQKFCQNEGKCRLSLIGLQSVQWFCDCAPGYHGDNCTEQCPLHRYGHLCVFSCYCNNNKPCFISNGSCSHGCREGYFGKDCSMVDMCISNPCQNGGTCFKDEDGFLCDCPHLYTGDTCSHLIEPNMLKYDKGFEDERKEIIKKEKKEIMILITKESTLPVSHVLSFNEDKTLFGSLTEFIVDKVEEYMFRRPPYENYAEDVDINMGCFREISSILMESRDLDGHMEILRKPMLIQTCRHLCRKKQFTFAGAMRGEVCLCGNVYGKYGAISHAACNEPCGGDNNGAMKCGGHEAYSLYPVCKFGQFGENCEEKCFCATYPCTVNFGRCPDNLCLGGWTGPHCNIKHISWTSTHKFGSLIFSSLMVYVIVCACIIIIILVRTRHEKNSMDHQWTAEEM